MSEYLRINPFIAVLSLFLMVLVAQTLLGPRSVLEKVLVVTIGVAMITVVLIFEAWRLEREADRWK